MTTMIAAAGQGPTAREKLIAFTNAQPLATLCESLALLDALPRLGEAERVARMAIIDSICERCPAADKAFDAWSESDDDPREPGEVIIAAVIAAAKAA
jgi:hypothetical protein